MKNKGITLRSALSLLCVLTVLLSVLSPAAFAEDAAGAAKEEETETTEAAAEGQLILGNADGSAGENEGKTIHLTSREEFEAFSSSCRVSAWSIGLSVVLDEDLDFGGRAVMPVPSFSGTFYGNGHTIRGFRCASNGSHQGLFRYLEADGRILDLNVTGSVLPGGSRSSVGGIVGTNRGTVTGCSFSGTVEGLISVGGIAGENLGVISDCKSEGSVYGKHFAGGVAGYSDGTIRSCTNFAEVNTEIRDESLDIETLDIRDIVGINLVTTEDADTVSDVGGVCGISLGAVKGCVNEGTVGYQHYGYNVGGIAGRQSGQMEDSVNNGSVLGRKDVGGVVGQMEPYLILDDSSSLADEISALQAAMDAAMGNMSANSETLGSSAQQVTDSGSKLTDHYVGEAIDDQSGVEEEQEKQEHRTDFQEAATDVGEAVGGAAGSLSEDTVEGIKNGELTEEEKQELINAGGGLASGGGTGLIERIERREADREEELRAMEEENARMRAEYASLASGLNSMGRTLHGTLSGLAGDMKSVNAHYSNILTMFTNALSGNLQLRLMEDISDLDTDEDMSGKVLGCTNNGDVSGDTDVGGVAGAMGVEAEFDLEGLISANITDAVQISTDSYFARCIVRKCVNNGAVTAKKDYNGGICGLAELGVISGNENYGDISAGGNYCGGIVGQSKSIVTGSYAMCAVAGGEYVGGIAGQGKRVVSCSSIVDIDETIACSGAICGWVDVEDENLFISRNTFVSDTLGGVDGISYDQAAVPVSYQELYEMQDLPERFRSLRVSFRADGLVVRELSVPYGGSVAAADIPPVPEKSGYSGFWPDTDLTGLTSSVTVDAVYLNRLTGLAGDYRREDSALPVVIIEGLFEPGSEVRVSDWRAGVAPLEHYRLCEALTVEIDSHVADLESFAIHYLKPDTPFPSGKPILCVRGENGLELCPYETDGSYMIFRASGSEIRFCVLAKSVDTAYLIFGAAALGLLIVILAAVLLGRRRRRRKAAAEAASAVTEENGAADAAPRTDELAAEGGGEKTAEADTAEKELAETAR